jgi:glycosyltransferase involved in cell wall biosynthesis
VKELSFDLVVPTLGRTASLQHFLDSLEAQSLREFRLLIADQNRDDRVERILVGYPELNVLRLAVPPRGLSSARNAALAHLKGDVVAFPDDDCVYPPELLRAVAARLARESDLDGVVGMAVDDRGRPSAASRWDTGAGALTLHNVWRRAVSITIFLRRRVVEQVGHFDESLGMGSATRFQSGEEVDYLIRAVRRGFRLEYDPSLRVVHPQGPSDEAAAARVAARNGLAMGELLRRHYGPVFSFYMIGRAGAGAFRAAASRDRTQWVVHSNALRGRLSGYLGHDRAPRAS